MFILFYFSSALTIDDEEREQLAREISKDWSSGIIFKGLIFSVYMLILVMQVNDI